MNNTRKLRGEDDLSRGSTSHQLQQNEYSFFGMQIEQSREIIQKQKEEIEKLKGTIHGNAIIFNHYSAILEEKNQEIEHLKKEGQILQSWINYLEKRLSINIAK
jgi:hypothetical protein